MSMKPRPDAVTVPWWVLADHMESGTLWETDAG